MRWSQGEIIVCRRAYRSWSNDKFFVREERDGWYRLLSKAANGQWVTIDTYETLEEAKEVAIEME